MTLTLLADNCCIHLSDISYFMRDREELEAYQVWLYWGVLWKRFCLDEGGFSKLDILEEFSLFFFWRRYFLSQQIWTNYLLRKDSIYLVKIWHCFFSPKVTVH